MRSKPACEATNDAPLTPPAGPGQHRLHGVLARRLEAHQPAVGAHDLERRPDVGGCEPVADVRQVLLEHRGDVRVHQRRHRALVLAELREDLGRDRHRQVGRDGGRDLRDHALVAAVRVGVQQAHRQRLDAVRDQLLDRLAHRSLVERLDDRAVGADPLGHLAHVARVGERLGLLVDHEAEQRPRRPRLGEVQDVPEPARDDQARRALRAARARRSWRRSCRGGSRRARRGRRPPASPRGGCPRSRRPTGRRGVLGVFASQTRWSALS